MDVTAEITMYPLREDYEKQVLHFLDLLKSNTGITVKVNAMSTQLQGDYDRVFEVFKHAIKSVYADGIKASFVIKFLPGTLDLNYEHAAS